MCAYLLFRISLFVWIVFPNWFCLVDSFSFLHTSHLVRPINSPSGLSPTRQVFLHLAVENDDSSNDEEDDEDEENPLSKGMDAIRWLPSVREKQTVEREEQEINVS
jgi:hypothetical protein